MAKNADWEMQDNTKEIDKRIDTGLAKAHRDLLKHTYTLAVLNAPVDTGNLRDSIEIAPTQSTGRGLYFGIIYSNAEYSIFVHEGFWHILAGRQIPANPFLRKAVTQAWPEFTARCQEIFREALQ